jgi:hypothetical protein
LTLFLALALSYDANLSFVKQENRELPEPRLDFDTRIGAANPFSAKQRPHHNEGFWCDLLDGHARPACRINCVAFVAKGAHPPSFSTIHNTKYVAHVA